MKIHERKRLPASYEEIMIVSWLAENEGLSQGRLALRVGKISDRVPKVAQFYSCFNGYISLSKQYACAQEAKRIEVK